MGNRFDVTARLAELENPFDVIEKIVERFRNKTLANANNKENK